MEADYTKRGAIFFARIFLLIILILLSACDIASKTNTPDLGSPNAPTFITDTGEDAAGPVAISMAENTQIPTDISMFAEDVDGNAISWNITTAPTKGTASMEPDNSPGESKTFSYLPDTDAIGGDTFEISIDDGTGFVDTMTVNVTIAARESFVSVGVLGYTTGNTLVLQLNGENDMPISNDGTYTFNVVLNSGDAYNVTITTTTEQFKTSCVLGNASGTMSSSNPTNVDLVCKDTVAPNITNKTPAAAEEKVALDTAINVVFDENMLATSMRAGVVSLVSPADPVTPVSGTISYSEPSRTLSFAPSVPLVGLLRPYTVTLSPDIMDISGQPLASSPWTFTTPDGDWGTAEIIANTQQIHNPQFAMNSVRQALVIWISYGRGSDGSPSIQDHLYSNHFDPGSGIWGVAKRIDGDYLGPRSIPDYQIALDTEGRGLALWYYAEDREGTPYGIQSKRFDPVLNEWETETVLVPAPIGAGNPDAGSLEMAMNSSGQAIAVWSQSGRISANYFEPETSGWGNFEFIENNFGGAHSPQIAVNSNGGVAVWVQPGADGAGQIWANYFDLDPGSVAKGWSEAELIGRTDQGERPTLQIAINSFGQGIAVWKQRDLDTQFNIWANYFDAATRTWGNKDEAAKDGAALIGTRALGTSGSVYGPKIALDSLGRGLATWSQAGETFLTGSALFANYFNPVKKEWDGATLIESEMGFQHQIALDPAGQGFAIWSFGGDTRAKRFNSADKSWNDTEIIGPGVSGDIRITLGARGRGVAIWQRGVTLNLNRFE